jgi:hypothetical protein
MRAPPLAVGLLVALVAVGSARAELPRLVLRIATEAERVLPTAHAVAPPVVRVRRRAVTRLGVTGAAVVPPPPSDVVALTRVEGLAVRALQPRLVVQSSLVRAVKLTPMWLGAHVTLEYTLPDRR